MIIPKDTLDSKTGETYEKKEQELAEVERIRIEKEEAEKKLK